MEDLRSLQNVWYFNLNVLDWKNVLSWGLKRGCSEKSFLGLPEELRVGQYYTFFDKRVFGEKIEVDDGLCWYWRTEKGSRTGPGKTKTIIFQDGLVKRSMSKHFSQNLKREVVQHKWITLVIYTCTKSCLLTDLRKKKKTLDALSRIVEEAKQNEKLTKKIRIIVIEDGAPINLKRVALNRTNDETTHGDSGKRLSPMNAAQPIENETSSYAQFYEDFPSTSVVQPSDNYDDDVNMYCFLTANSAENQVDQSEAVVEDNEQAKVYLDL